MLKPTKSCFNCFNPHQHIGIYCPQSDKPINNMTITKQQFDNLKVGDTLKNDSYTLIVEAKFANTIMTLDNDDDYNYLSFKELQEEGYSINQQIQHNCGFSYGNYENESNKLY